MCFLSFGCCRLAAKVKKLIREVDLLRRQTETLTDRVESIDNQVLTGQTIVPALIDYFGNRTIQKVQVSTTFVTLEGIVIATAEDGVQIREQSGNLVLIPFSKITAAH
ncbi:hypothetical protein [Paenibacillus faecalis]|uniref:hypothetical protein n=1 Tax=Paenibacillus faecalis TaxID=2079532 RepID=UPI000D0F862B|nr:hypothetical protein [Paenibacillus faecalis]